MIKDTPSKVLCAVLLVATTAVTVGAAAAVAQTQPSAPSSTANLLSLAEIESRLTAEGLTIRELEIRDLLVEVEGHDANGREIELVIDRRTGETMSRKSDD